MMKTKMNEIDSFMAPLPVSFRVIGIGTGATDIIDKVKSFGYDCVGCQVVDSADGCIPTDEDRMVIIVATDNTETANAIAKTFHDAGVLTIGFLNNAASACYDSIAIDAHFNDFPEIIKTLLQPIVTPGIINFDFNDIRTELRDSEFFKILTAETGNVETAVAEIQKSLNGKNGNGAEHLSAHIYFNRKKRPEIKMDDMVHISNLISSLPENINAMWSVNIDETLQADKIRLSIIMSGKELK